MDVTSVRIALTAGPPPASDGRPGKSLLATVSLEFDSSFVVYGVKIVRTPQGSIIVCMPQEPIGRPCHSCGKRCPSTARFCPVCGQPMPDDWRDGFEVDDRGRRKLYQDVCFPYVPELRRRIDELVLAAYRKALAEETLPAREAV